MIEVFKTNIQSEDQATNLINGLSQEFPGFMITVDIEDCDKILRMENRELFNSDAVLAFAKDKGIEIEVLLD